MTYMPAGSELGLTHGRLIWSSDGNQFDVVVCGAVCSIRLSSTRPDIRFLVCGLDSLFLSSYSLLVDKRQGIASDESPHPSVCRGLLFPEIKSICVSSRSKRVFNESFQISLIFSYFWKFRFNCRNTPEIWLSISRSKNLLTLLTQLNSLIRLFDWWWKIGNIGVMSKWLFVQNGLKWKVTRRPCISETRQVGRKLPQWTGNKVTFN